jgi:hypothetical protein
MWVLLQEFDGNAFRSFVNKMAARPDSVHEDRMLREMNIDPKALQEYSNTASNVLDRYRKEFSTLVIGEPVALLLNNREIVPVRGETELIEILSANPTAAGGG